MAMLMRGRTQFAAYRRPAGMNRGFAVRIDTLYLRNALRQSQRCLAALLTSDALKVANADGHMSKLTGSYAYDQRAVVQLACITSPLAG
jgi:hypothetical protein